MVLVPTEIKSLSLNRCLISWSVSLQARPSCFLMDCCCICRYSCGEGGACAVNRHDRDTGITKVKMSRLVFSATWLSIQLNILNLEFQGVGQWLIALLSPYGELLADHSRAAGARHRPAGHGQPLRLQAETVAVDLQREILDLCNTFSTLWVPFWIFISRIIC